MSLSGSIEDLPLLEILQVVAFCQKTGHLVVRAPEGDAGVVFSAGRVVAGYAWDLPAFDHQGGGDRETRLRARLADLLERLVRLREGEFAFNLAEQVPARLEGRDLAGETLEYGINPEELMLDLARKLDEDRRDCAAVLEASFVAPPEAAAGGGSPPEADVEPEPAPGTAAALEALAEPDLGDEALEELALEELPADEVSFTVLLVDDEPEVLRVVGDRLEREGLAAAKAASTSEARRAMARLSATGRPLLLAVDLGLPSESGTSFRGGLDVVRYASGLQPAPPVLLMAETIDEKLRARARRLGVSMLAFKPWLSKLDPLQYEADLRAFGDKLARDLLPRLAARSTAPAVAPPRPPSTAAPAEPLEEALRRALEEIEAHPDPDRVALLLLSAARAFFPRGVLFVAKDDRLRGLAGFGPAADGDSLDRLARELIVPLDADSPFGRAVASGRPWQGPLPADGPVRELAQRIGAFDGSAAALVPLRVMHETIAVLYGDAPDGSALPPITPLARFVERAGRALEETMATRRVALAAAS